MTKEVENMKKELKKQNQFIRSLLKPLEDIKKGRIKDFEFSKRHN